MPRTMDSDQTTQPHPIAPGVSDRKPDAMVGFDQLEPRTAVRDAMADPEKEQQRSGVTMKNALSAGAPMNADGQEHAGEGQEMPPTAIAKAVR